MTKPLRTTGIVFLTMLLVLLSLMVPVHAEDQKAAGAETTGAGTKSIYDNNYDMGSLTVDDFKYKMIFMITKDENTILDKSTIMRGSGNGYYILRFSTPEETYKAYGYYKSRNDSVNISYSIFPVYTMIQNVSFNANGGSGSMDTQIIKTACVGHVAENKTALNKNSFARDGYAFAGWNTKIDGSGRSYSDNEEVYEVIEKDEKFVPDAKKIITSKTLYAQWTPNKYTVRYHANGGTGQMVNQEMAYGTEEALISKGFTRDGYTFTGWNTKADGSGTAYGDKEVVKDLTGENGGTVDLYAQWSKDNSGALSGFVGPKTGDDNDIGRDILILAAACTLVIVLRVKRAKGISE